MRVLDHFVVTGTNHFVLQKPGFLRWGAAPFFLHVASGALGPGVQARCRQTPACKRVATSDLIGCAVTWKSAPTESIESWRARYKMARGVQGPRRYQRRARCTVAS